jgi:hypothetical protein
MPYAVKTYTTPLWGDRRKTLELGYVSQGVAFSVNDFYPKGEALADTMLHTKAVAAMSKDGEQMTMAGWIDGKNIEQVTDAEVIVGPPGAPDGALITEAELGRAVYTILRALRDVLEA